MGPVSAAELKRLALAGELRRDDLLWREGLTDWSAAKNVRGLFEDERKPPGESSIGQTGGGAQNKPIPPVVGVVRGESPVGQTGGGAGDTKGSSINETQQGFLILGLFAFLAAVAFPPWTVAETAISCATVKYDFLFSPPNGNVSMNYGILGVECLAVAIATGVLYLANKK
jgi:hypothetical protein